MRKTLTKLFLAFTLVLTWTSCQDENANPEPEPTYCVPENYTFKVVFDNQNRTFADVSFSFNEKNQVNKYIANRAIFTNETLNSIDITLDQNNQLAKEHFGIITNNDQNIEFLRTFEVANDTTIVALLGPQLEGDSTSFFIQEMTIYTLDENKYPKEAFLYQTDVGQSDATGQYVFTPYIKQIQNWKEGNLLLVDFLFNEDELIAGENARTFSQRINSLPNIPIEVLKKRSLRYSPEELIQTLRDEDDDKMVSQVKREFSYDDNPSSMQYVTPMIFSMQAIINPTLIVSKNNITSIKETTNEGSITTNGTPSKNGLQYGTGTTYSFNGQPIFEIKTDLLCK